MHSSKPEATKTRRVNGNFTLGEKDLLTKLVLKYAKILECRRVDAISSYNKKRQWDILTREWNSKPSNSQRTASQLRKCWCNMKARRKAQLAHENAMSMEKDTKDALPRVAEVFKCSNMLEDMMPSMETGIGTIAQPIEFQFRDVDDSDNSSQFDRPSSLKQNDDSSNDNRYTRIGKAFQEKKKHPRQLRGITKPQAMEADLNFRIQCQRELHETNLKYMAEIHRLKVKFMNECIETVVSLRSQ